MQILHLLLIAPNSCKFRGKFAFVHNFLHLFPSFQIAHSVEREGLVWKVMGSSPSEVIFLFSSRLQLIGANNATNCLQLKVANIATKNSCSWWLQILHPDCNWTRNTANSCNFCNQNICMRNRHFFCECCTDMFWFAAWSIQCKNWKVIKKSTILIDFEKSTFKDLLLIVML